MAQPDAACLYNRLIHLPRSVKRLILMTIDVSAAPLAFSLALALRYGVVAPWSVLQGHFLVIALLMLAAPIALVCLGVHRIKLENMEVRAAGRLGLVALALAGTAIVISYMASASTPRSVPLIFGVLYFVTCLSARVAMLMVLSALSEVANTRQRAVIYGAGSAGTQIAAALCTSRALRPIFFVDDSAAVQGLQIAGLHVRRPQDLPDLIAQHRIDIVVLALPSIDPTRRGQIVRSLEALNVMVKMLPCHAELLERGGIEDGLRNVRPDELLERARVDLDVPAVAVAYAGRTVMVTGAGGSIGAELCRQLIDCHPRRIVLFDHSEFALYQIDQELRSLMPPRAAIEISTHIGSVTDPARVRSVIKQDAVEIILHAAAYKHVPLVEANELEGARNNVIGTSVVAEAAIAAGVARFVLVSTDKAVRPTNVMGATKRLAENIVQDLQTRTTTTNLAMVRFGNVLGSSGSVLPLFQQQIERGGPVTVTHPDVTRFFMTIPEAARLVLLAGAFATGGDLFVLDMGRPVRVIDIARRLIDLSGRHVRSAQNPDGIAIKITGLRPGEKLFEELLIDRHSVIATPHPKLLRAKERCLSEIETAAMLRDVNTALRANDPHSLRSAINRYVHGVGLPAVDTPARGAVGGLD